MILLQVQGVRCEFSLLPRANKLNEKILKHLGLWDLKVAPRLKAPLATISIEKNLKKA